MTAIRVIASTLFFVPFAVTAAAQTVATSSPVPQPVLTTTTTPTIGTTPTTGTGTPTPPPTTLGSYDRLSIGNRRIARALFEAQNTETTPGTGTTPTGTTGTTAGGTGATTTPRNLTLDEIASLKQGGQGWGQVFKQLKTQGLVAEKNLGQVLSQYNKQQHASRWDTTTAGNRPVVDAGGSSNPSDGNDKGDRGAGNGNGRGHSKVK